MKKLILSACVCACAALIVSPAFAQDSGAQSASSPPAAAGGGQQPGQNFDQRKSKILERIGEGIARMQKAQSCVQAATTPDALRACAPQRPEGRQMGHGGRWSHGGGGFGGDDQGGGPGGGDQGPGPGPDDQGGGPGGQ